MEEMLRSCINFVLPVFICLTMQLLNLMVHQKNTVFRTFGFGNDSRPGIQSQCYYVILGACLI